MNPSSLPTLASMACDPVARRTLDPSQSALVVIDIQEKLLPAVVRIDELVSNCRLLIRLAHILEIPVLLTTQYRAAWANVPQIAELLPGVEAIDKVEFGCFGCEDFRTPHARLPGHRTPFCFAAWRTTSA